jgi:polar amino acid transport system substrate-binding protein
MVMSGMTMTPKRNMRVAFVGPYMITGKAALTKIETIASIEDPSEIDSPKTRVAVLKGSTSDVFVREMVPNARRVTTRDYDEAVKLVLEDRVDAMIADYPICIVSLFRYPDEGLLSILHLWTYEPIGIALPANDPLFVNWVENFVETLDDSGKLELLKVRWVADGSWLTKLP